MRASVGVLLVCFSLPASAQSNPTPKQPAAPTPTPTGAASGTTPKTAPSAPASPDSKAQVPPGSVPSALASSCAVPTDAATLEVAVGSSKTSPDGLRVDYAGTTRDHYADGRFDAFATLRFRRGAQEEPWLPSVLAPSPARVILGHCIALRHADDRRAVLQVAALPGAAKPDAAKPDAAKPAKPVDKPPTVRHLGDGRCEPTPREHSPCTDGEGYCVLSWGKPQGWSSALWCRGGTWVIENERNL